MLFAKERLYMPDPFFIHCRIRSTEEASTAEIVYIECVFPSTQEKFATYVRPCQPLPSSMTDLTIDFLKPFPMIGAVFQALSAKIVAMVPSETVSVIWVVVSDHHVPLLERYARWLDPHLLHEKQHFHVREESSSYLSRIFLQEKKVQWNEQQRAIIHTDPLKNICIIAGAGCGKTTTLIARILHLIQEHQVPESAILLMTFTKDAANDMVTKLEKSLGYSTSMMVGTIDSIAYRVVQRYDPELFAHCQQVGEYKYALKKFLARTHCPFRQQFTDQIRYLMVDEFQDINPVYYDIIQSIHRGGARVTCVGDDAQNIYTFNGSDVRFLLNFTSHFRDSEVFFLTTNYRSTPEVITLANQSIALNNSKYSKTIQPQKPSEGIKPLVVCFEDWQKEADFMVATIKTALLKKQPLHEIAILSRNMTEKGMMFFLEGELSRAGIAVQVLENFNDSRPPLRKNHVCLATLHKSKGLEWDLVFLTGCADQFFPSGKSLTTTEGLEEERRLFYVGVTRAKRHLVLSLNTKPMNLTLSRFITELPKDLFRWKDVRGYHFVANQKEQAIQMPCISKIVETFSTEMIYLLRQQSFFPNLQAVRTQVHEGESKYPDWVIAQDLYAPFGTFVDNVICRQIGEQQQGHMDHREASMILSHLLLERTLMDIYRRHKLLFQLNLSRFDLHQNYEYQLDAVVETLCTDADLRGISVRKEDHASLYHIVLRILDKARRFGRDPGVIFPCSKGFLPSDRWDKVANSYRAYCDASQKWENLLMDIFCVSWCGDLVKGRKRMLYREWDPNLFQGLLPWLRRIEEHFVKDSLREEAPQCKIVFTRDAIAGECDLYQGTSQRVVDFKVSKNDSPTIQNWLQVLFYVCSLRLSETPVKEAAIYNPLSGYLHVVNLRQWDGHEALWEWLVQQQQRQDPTAVDADLEFCKETVPKDSMDIETPLTSTIPVLSCDAVAPSSSSSMEVWF